MWFRKFFRVQRGGGGRITSACSSSTLAPNEICEPISTVLLPTPSEKVYNIRLRIVVVRVET